jgi:hypothetical protein
VRVGVDDFSEVLCTLNREGCDLNQAQLQAIIERCVASGTVTRHFDSEGAAFPLLMTIISWGEEDITPNKRPMIDEADSAFESDKSLSRYTTTPQTKKKKAAKKTKQKSSSVMTNETPDRSLAAFGFTKQNNVKMQPKKIKLAHNGGVNGGTKTKAAKITKQKSSSVMTIETPDRSLTAKKQKLSGSGGVYCGTDTKILIGARAPQAKADKAEAGVEKCLKCYLNGRSAVFCRTTNGHKKPGWSDHECVRVVKEGLSCRSKGWNRQKKNILPVGTCGRSLLEKHQSDCPQCHGAMGNLLRRRRSLRCRRRMSLRRTRLFRQLLK